MCNCDPLSHSPASEPWEDGVSYGPMDLLSKSGRQKSIIQMEYFCFGLAAI